LAVGGMVVAGCGRTTTYDGINLGGFDAAPACEAPQNQCGGSCVDPNSDPQNCGRCGMVCAPGQGCSNSACQMGGDLNLTQCGSACVNLQQDPLHCGDCNNRCSSGGSCVGGQCQGGDCISPRIKCGTQCVDPRSDHGNCGGCGAACSPDAVCSNSNC